MDNSKRGNIHMQERLELNKTQGASTLEEVKRTQNVPYASSVGSIMYAVIKQVAARSGMDSKMAELSTMMKGYPLLILLIAATFVSAKKIADVTELQIGVKFKPASCEIQAHKGDRIKVHYRGKLTDGTVFDSSFERGDPIEFELGSGQVIKGWDQGILGMCVGEKRKLKIPAKLGYGEQGSPPTIPGGATLIFDTELVAVNGKGSGEEETDDSEL
ncbi:peptidyl-prolyl cis-trans isomerase FKBP15-1-like protein [Tanacetum coccineum]